MEKIIKDIIAKKMTCIVLSPHQDDAVLSCTTLLTKLVGKTNVSVINVFTKANNKPYTLSARTFMKYSNDHMDANKLYEERRKEDREVLGKIGIIPVNLNLEDALFRKKSKSSLIGNLFPEIDHVYPTYRWHIIKSVAKNDPAIVTLQNKFLKYKKKNIIIFAPYGMGNHADHKLVRMVAETLFDNLILYSDFPYNMRFKTYGKALENGKEYRLKVTEKKDELIKGYRTQFNGLFPNAVIPQHEEVYFTKGTFLK